MVLALPPGFLHGGRGQTVLELSVHTWSAGSEHTAMPFYLPQNLLFNCLFGIAQVLPSQMFKSLKKPLFKTYHIVSISNLGDKNQGTSGMQLQTLHFID